MISYAAACSWRTSCRVGYHCWTWIISLTIVRNFSRYSPAVVVIVYVNAMWYFQSFTSSSQIFLIMPIGEIWETGHKLPRRISLLNLNHFPNHRQKLLTVLTSRRRNRHWTFQFVRKCDVIFSKLYFVFSNFPYHVHRWDLGDWHLYRRKSLIFIYIEAYKPPQK
jgi:hypothetical protein